MSVASRVTALPTEVADQPGHRPGAFIFIANGVALVEMALRP